MKKYAVFLMLFCLAWVAVPAHASNYFCTGTVSYLGIGNDGTVVVAGPGGITAVEICQVGTTANGITSDTCKSWYATLLGAKISGQQVSVDFSDNLTCTTQVGWTKWAAVYFVSTQ